MTPVGGRIDAAIRVSFCILSMRMSDNLSGLPTDQSESACAGEGRHLTRLGQFCYILFCLNALFFGYLGVVNPNIFYVSLLDEGGVVENLTFVVFLLGSFVLFAAALATRRLFPRCVYVLGGMTLLFFAGEEISWGQRVIGFETPDFLMGLNTHREFNIHNLETFDAALQQRAAMFMVCVAACTAFLLRKNRILGISAPPILLTLALLVTMTYFYTPTIDIYRSFNYGYRGLLLLLLMVGLFSGNARLFIATAASLSISLFTDHLRHHELRHHGDNIRFEEIGEYLFSLFCFFYALYLLLDQKMARQKITASVAAFKSAASIPSIRITPPLPDIGRKSFPGIKGEFLTPWTGICALITAGSIGLAIMLHLHYRADAAAIEETRLLTQTLAPVARSNFDVYIDERDDLRYFKQSCTRGFDSTEAFFLGIFPVNVDDLPVDRRPHGFENNDFVFGQYGQMIDGACAITVRLPDYEIASVSTGQYTFDWNGVATNLWVADFPYRSADDSRAYAAAFEETRSLIRTMEPAARSNFDVYIDGRDLRYFKQSCASDPDSTEAFFLGIFPVNVDDLPVERRTHGFEGKDFAFGQYGQMIGGACAITVRLPDYEIASISTGQYTWDENGVATNLWIAEFPYHSSVDDSRAYAAAFEETRSLIRTMEPAARSNFDVYIDGRDLRYFKQSCASDPDSTEAFFLGIFPVNEDDLPVEWRPHGFESKDFAFGQYGQMIDGACAITVRLPGYEIARISTGQYTWDEKGVATNLWIADFPVNK